MAQAAKLFDRKNGGSPSNPAASQAKVRGSLCFFFTFSLLRAKRHDFFTHTAMHAAASTAMRLATQYKTTGRISFQHGEMQSLISAAMALF